MFAVETNKCATSNLTPPHAHLDLLRVRQLLPQLIERMLVDRQHFGARAFGLDLRVQLLDLLLVLLEHARVGASRLVDLVFGAPKGNPKGKMMQHCSVNPDSTGLCGCQYQIFLLLKRTCSRIAASSVAAATMASCSAALLSGRQCPNSKKYNRC
jgi:hypothetical protein